MIFPPLLGEWGIPGPYAWIPDRTVFAAYTGYAVGARRHLGLLEIFSHLSLVAAAMEETTRTFGTQLVLR